MSNFGDHPAGFFGASGFYNGATSTSMRFRRGLGSNTEINRDPSSAGDRKKHTLAFWVKRCTPSDGSQVILGAFASSYSDFFYFRSDDRLEYNVGNAYSVATDMKFRDVSAWYHIVAHFDVANSTTTSRLRFWVNGVEQTKTVTYGSYPADQNYAFSNTVDQTVGGLTHFGGYELDGYLCDLNFIDGSLVPYTSFGEFNNGVWIPIKIDTSAITYGTNGFRMLFNGTDTDGASTSGTVNANSVGASSVNSNHFHAYSTALSNHSALPDNPENNFCTLNPLENAKKFADSNQALMTQSEGNLKFSGTRNVFGTIAVTSGKWYWEIINTSNTVNSVSVSGVVTHGSRAEHYAVYYNRNGNKGIGIMASGATESSYGATYTDDDIIGVALNMDDNQVTFFKNNADQGTITDANLATGEVHAWTQNGNNSGTLVGVYNFGQDSSFAGAKTAQGNTDGNGIGDFYYAPPSGFLAMCSANLPKPTIGPDSATQSDDHFNTVIYSGNDDATRTFNIGFPPDWTWFKVRNQSGYGHQLYDSSRGVHKYLQSNVAGTEQTSTEGVTSFNTNGNLVIGTNAFLNEAGSNGVIWNWKANGGTTSSNTDGSITSTVQANTTAGFSIVTYTGRAGATDTIGHGLGVVPAMYIVKRREAFGTPNWAVYNKGTDASSPQNYFTRLDTTVGRQLSSTMWNNTAPTSSVFSIGTSNLSNYNQTFVAYCFAEVEGYSKFGSYTGNGNNNGTFVFTGFRPAFIMTKRTNDTSNWVIQDSVRQTFNPSDAWLRPNTNDAEGTTSPDLDVDFVSNGFKIRNNGTDNNIDGSTYTYMAFAEAPFKYANAR